MAQLINKWVMSCKQCIKESRIDRRLACLPLQNPSEHIKETEGARQFDLVPDLPPSVGYKDIVTAMDAFSRYLIVYLTSNQDVKTIAEIIFNKMLKHAYLPTTTISDKGSEFMSHVIKEVVGVPKHAKTKHVPRIGMPERSDESIGHILQADAGERRSLLHK